MEASADDLANDLASMSFNSTTTATDIHRSTSSSSDWTASSSAHFPPHKPLSLSDIRFLHRLGAGDIGSVYLAELKPPAKADAALFAAKVMDKKELASRNKVGRARTEKEILEMLDHPFLPTLYAALDSPKWSCLLTEFCPGGDLHVLRQRQPYKRFPDSAVRFYASEVVAALEYIHMVGIVYRDLKPENILVRSDGHIMLTDFDLSLMCDDSTSTPAQVISSHNQPNAPPLSEHAIDALPFRSTSCILPNCIVPSVSCLNPRRKHRLNDLAIIALESEMLEKIAYGNIVEDFISKNTKRMMLFK
ncbi:hypothetical protein SASPL_122570 [Salvia splendens]|uniref:non-specific serine/threonine protein kinase n=1 Tax=Salvia splendens TaxID=180675 RepID=A0A8X8ZSK5_SALSN|nr:hypothetical protein SASPL_122570 [Salvia splendens]